MRFKDYLLPLIAAVGIAMVVQYYMTDKTKKVDAVAKIAPGREHYAPDVEDAHRPLQFDVDFDESAAIDHKAEITEIATDYAQYSFSTDGGVLDQISFNHQVSGPHASLASILPSNKESRCFLLALAEKTPYYYELIEKKELDDFFELVYQSDASVGKIIKKYKVYKHTCQVDVHVSVEPKVATDNYQLRMLYPSPVIGGVVDDVVQGVVAEPRYGLIKKSMIEIANKPYWDMPPLFGAEDRYFVFTLIKDHAMGVRRAYFKLNGADQLISILETKKITGSFELDLSFYFGPKRVELMDAVDARLSQTLEYGWLTPLSRGFVRLLNLINDYVKNYGIAIILLTILIKLCMLPFTWQGEKGMKKQMELQRKMQYLQQKYKHDRQALAEAQSELMRTHGMGSVAGCLPMLLQIPVFICLNKALSNAVELFGAPFLWVPDLAAKDPYYILPLLAGGSMVATMLFSPRSSNVGVRQNMTMVAFALLFGAFATNFAAGLSLYLFVNMILTVSQTWAYSYIKGR
jgi:YidC/Oxa1 family membrane protein insertase